MIKFFDVKKRRNESYLVSKEPTKNEIKMMYKKKYNGKNSRKLKNKKRLINKIRSKKRLVKYVKQTNKKRKSIKSPGIFNKLFKKDELNEVNEPQNENDETDVNDNTKDNYEFDDLSANQTKRKEEEEANKEKAMDIAIINTL